MPSEQKKKRAKAPSDTKLGRLEILMEDVSSQMRLLTETVAGRMDGLERKIDEFRAELIVRIEVLESVVRQNSIDILKNSADIAELRAELNQMRAEVRTLATQTALSALEARVSKIERHLNV